MEIGDDINGDPHKSWSLIDFTLSGTHFKDIKSTSRPDIFNKNADSFGKNGMSDKSRISGNNARSIVDEFYTPENANKFFYGHVSVPEGSTQGYRDAWTNEAFVELEVIEPNGTVTREILPTIGKSATEPGVSVYGEDPRGGIFVYEHNKFIEPGTTFEVIRAWRGNEDPDGDGVHESLPSDIKTSKVVATDTTPPLPATIETDVFYEIDSELSGKWSIDGSHNSDLVVDGKILVNDVEVLSTFTVNSDYTWNAIIDDSVDLNPKDIIQVILIDENGNENPTTTVDYHDTTFIEGPKLQITKAEYVLTATDKIIGRADAKAIKTDADLLKLIEASAIYVPDSSRADVEVISSDFKAEAGTYTIEVAVTKNKSINRVVTVEVLPYDNVVIGEDYIIGANDFYLSYRNAEDLSNLELIEKANAKAFRKDDYTVMSDVSVVYNGIKNVEGVYDVAFAVVNEPSTIVTSKAIVFKNDIVVESDDYIIVADHFALDLEQVENLDDNLLITSANARAFKKGDMSEVNVEVKSHQIIDEVGKYEVIFNIEDEKDTTVEVLAHVFNEVDEVNQIGWSGINAILKLDELSDGAVKASTRIKAFDISDLTNVEELDNNLITVSNLPTGVTDFYGHDVIFRIENNGNTSRFDLTVYVFDDVITETSGRNLSNSSRQNGYAINAYNFEAVSGNVVTRKQVKDLASVDIFKITNGSVKPMPELRDDATVNPFPLLEGVNKMTYSFAFDNNVIKAEKTAIIRDTDISLQTKNAVISLADANSLTNEQLIDLVVKSVSHSDSTITADQIKVEPFPLAVGKNYVNYSFECNNNVIQTTKVATISDSDIMLEMKNAIVDLDTAQTITEEQLKDLVVSKVGHIDSSVNVDDITVSISNNALNELNGLLKANTDGIIVEFTAKYGLDEVSMTSTVYVFDEVDNSNSDFVIGWTGNDAFTKLAELSEDKVREVTNVKAFNVTNPERITQIDDKDITLSNVPTGVSIEGTLVEFSVTNQLHTSKHNQLVYVFDDVVTNPKGEMIAYTGKDYATTIDKLEESDEYFISKNEIKYLN